MGHIENGPEWVPELTEEDVRRIVREELGQMVTQDDDREAARIRARQIRATRRNKGRRTTPAPTLAQRKYFMRQLPQGDKAIGPAERVGDGA